MKLQKVTYYLLLLLLLSVLPQQGRAQKYSETELKAAYLYNFTLFIDWPLSVMKKEKFVIATYKDKEMYIVLKEMLSNKKIKGKPVEIIEITTDRDFLKPDMLFLGNKVSAEEFKRIENIIKDKPMLTVGNEIRDFCRNGGIINFAPRFSSKRFEINNEKALSLGLKISSKLLILSKIINTNENRF